jgi:predicted  nucleic acid-binding Zn-ribbon protein
MNRTNRQNIPTLASIAAQKQQMAAQEQAIAEQRKKIEEQEAAVLADQQAKVKSAFESLPQTIGAVLGRQLSLSDALKMGLDHVKGKLSLSNGANGAGQTAVRRYRTPLSDEEKNRLKAVLTARQAVIDAGRQPDKTLSQISQDFKTTDATVNKYKAAWGLTRGSRA